MVPLSNRYGVSESVGVYEAGEGTECQLYVITNATSLASVFLVVFTAISWTLVCRDANFVSSQAIEAFTSKFERYISRFRYLRYDDPIRGVYRGILRLPRPGTAQNAFSAKLHLARLSGYADRIGQAWSQETKFGSAFRVFMRLFGSRLTFV